MKTCQNCIHLIYPTITGYACKKIGWWGSDLPLHGGGSCKKWKLTNRNDDVNGFVPIEPMRAGIYYRTKHAMLYYED